VSYQAHRQEHTEKRIECQAKTRPPVRHTRVVDEEAMDEVKNAVPNHGEAQEFGALVLAGSGDTKRDGFRAWPILP
jgi:hypothetical protein